MKVRSALAVVLFAGIAGAQAPVAIPNPHFQGNGHAQTWDGRLFVVTRPVNGTPAWLARVLRPEAVERDAAGRPRFTAQAFSPWATLELGDAANTGMSLHNALAFVPTPGVQENPYPSDAAGGRSASTHSTYDALVVTQHYVRNDDRLGQRRARFVVAQPHTAQARVVRADMLDAFQEFRTQGGQPLRGIEPTLTFDGHFLVWQGHPANDGRIGVLMYSYTQTPGRLDGWSPPRTLSALYYVDREVTLGGLPLHERVPLAKHPLRDGLGGVYAQSDPYRGAYPWISRDGTELFHTATVAGQGNLRALRGGLSVIGRWTGWTQRHIDGSLNPDREQSVRLFFSSPGPSPSFWRPYPEVRDGAIPYSRGRPVYPLFGSNTGNYGEVSFDDHEDGDYALVLHLNELVARSLSLNPDYTPDTSGHHGTGRVEGARFPLEHTGRDEVVGVQGQALYFDHAAQVRVPSSPALRDLPSVTASLWVRRLVDLRGDAPNRYRFLLQLPGTLHLILEENGALHARVWRGGQVYTTLQAGGVPLDRWTHVAVTYDATSGKLRLFQDAVQVKAIDVPPGPLDAATGDLLLGPAGAQPRAPQVPAGGAELLLDELELSRVARSPAELARSAFLPPAPASFPGRLQGIALPQGLDARDLRLPHVVTPARAELGRLLFFDPRLSQRGEASCATCHAPGLGFGDGRPVSQGAQGPLERNAPTVLNRAFSTLQFFDGRAATLEAQAAQPLTHPNELGLSLAEGAARVGQIPGYVLRFQQAYGALPSAALIRIALADYQRSLLSGNSKVDRFEAGEAAALSAAERRGRLLFRTKARCTACHAGSTFSDEAFHDSGFFDPATDPGRGQITGRARDRGRFKTPTLRDVARTAPYLHDGSAQTLEEVVELYDRGGRTAVGRDPELRPLALSAGEKADLVAFLRALDGDWTHAAPGALPPNGDGTRPAVGGPGFGAFTPSAEHLVRAVYQDVLGRRASAAEVRAQAARVRQGGRRAFVGAVLQSDEALARRVDGAYRRMLGRAADPSGRATWTRALRAGTPEADLLAALASSGEYRRAHPVREPWVRQVYLDLLGRAGDPGGVAAHTAALRASGDATYPRAQAFSHSDEFRRTELQALYRGLLGRAAATSAVDAWLARFRAGATLAEAEEGILVSDEYFDRAPGR
ncbi:MAG: cytochrome c peroxidase [Planctomycetota bacterium]